MKGYARQEYPTPSNYYGSGKLGPLAGNCVIETRFINLSGINQSVTVTLENGTVSYSVNVNNPTGISGWTAASWLQYSFSPTFTPKTVVIAPHSTGTLQWNPYCRALKNIANGCGSDGGPTSPFSEFLGDPWASPGTPTNPNCSGVNVSCGSQIGIGYSGTVSVAENDGAINGSVFLECYLGASAVPATAGALQEILGGHAF